MMKSRKGKSNVLNVDSVPANDTTQDDKHHEQHEKHQNEKHQNEKHHSHHHPSFLHLMEYVWSGHTPGNASMPSREWIIGAKTIDSQPANYTHIWRVPCAAAFIEHIAEMQQPPEEVIKVPKTIQRPKYSYCWLTMSSREIQLPLVVKAMKKDIESEIESAERDLIRLKKQRELIELSSMRCAEDRGDHHGKKDNKKDGKKDSSKPTMMECDDGCAFYGQSNWAPTVDLNTTIFVPVYNPVELSAGYPIGYPPGSTYYLMPSQ